MPIGPRGTSAVSRITMNLLDRKLIVRLEILRIETRLLMRYIDDIRILLRKLRAGSMIKGNKIVIDSSLILVNLDSGSI